MHFTANLSGRIEIQFKFKLTNIVDMLTPILQYNSYNRIFMSTGGILTVYADGGASEAHYFGVFDTDTFQTNVDYLVKITYDGSSTWTVSRTNLSTGVTDTETATLAYGFPNSTLYWVVGRDSTRYLRGTVDLKSINAISNSITVFSGYMVPSFCLESEWQATVSTYGTCGKFVYEEATHSVRLPRLAGFIEGTVDSQNLGSITQAGLPNITGTATAPADAGASPGYYPFKTGAFYSPDSNTRFQAYSGWTSTTDPAFAIGFDASRSNSIYGNSSTVQPQSVKVFYYIVVATATKTPVSANIDNVVTSLNNKADKDLTNLNTTGKTKICNYPMPSSTYDTLVLGASETTYTAPANGYFLFSFAGGGLSYYGLHGPTLRTAWVCEVATYGGALYLPAKEGDVITVIYQIAPQDYGLYFIYAEGEK